MKSPPFGYAAPTTIAEAIALLGSDPVARPLAGGQSLLPLLGLRLAAPTVLVDLERISELAGIEAVGPAVRIGAMTRQSAGEHSDLLRDRFPVVVTAIEHIGYPAIRNRGTFGGSLAHADPAAELPVLAVALDATVTVRGAQGERTVRAEDFLLGPFEVDVRPGELLTHMDLPANELDWTFLELSRRHGDFAIVMVAVGVRMTGGRCAAARIVVGGASATPVRMRAAEQALVETDSKAADDGLADEVARQAASELNPTSDVHGSADYRRRVAEVLLSRALRQAVGGAP